MNFEDVRQIALSFPGVEEHLAFGRPTFKVSKRFLACIAKIDPDALCLKLPDVLEREFLVNSQPEIYYVTKHYSDFGAILVRLPKVDPEELRDLFERAWRAYAPKRVVASYRVKE
jgi:hypothetical protein